MRPGRMLLPNAWDVAWSLGVPDGAALGAERAAAVIARIVAALDVPVSPTTR
jgi:2-methylisocitrate lyase-like PEP mutase family enzyme